MTKRMLIDATHAEETRVVVLDGSRVEDYDVEAATRKQLKGNIYLAKVVRVEPSLQAAFVDYGGNRHGFLAFAEIHPDYYQIPVADRQKLLAMQEAEARAAEEAEEAEAAPPPATEPPADDPPADDPPFVDDAALAANASPPEAEALVASGEEQREPPGTTAEAAAGALPEAPAEIVALPSEPAAAEADLAPEAPPPETVGGDADGSEELRPPRIPSQFLRQYKIQEVVHRRQILLVQVVKEERGAKGAALTTYISLAGRYSVLMPNSPRGGGVSRKITSPADRRRLKEISAELQIPSGMGLIVRTAGANRPKPEIRRDCEYLLRLWDEIRDTVMQSVAPSLIYEEASLIKRAIRDVYSRDIEELLVDGEEGWHAARDFMRMLMPTHARKVQLWKDPAGRALFAHEGVEAELDQILTPTVPLRSGGSLVINQAEALVAIDVNSGRATRERNIEETALRTNLEAAEEAARQLRLRDLAGLIVIDFIDMESRKHNGMVERRLKEALKTDRARVQVGHISHFGLLEMSRQRLHPSLAETSFTLCPNCAGTGHVRSVESAAIHLLRMLEDEGSHRPGDLRVRVGSAVALYILNHKRAWLHDLEARHGIGVSFAVEDTEPAAAMRIERLRTPPEVPAPAAAQEEAPLAPAAPDEPPPAAAALSAASEGPEDSEEGERRRRRRRRRRRHRDDAAAPAAEALPPERAEQPELAETPNGKDHAEAEPPTPRRRRDTRERAPHGARGAARTAEPRREGVRARGSARPAAPPAAPSPVAPPAAPYPAGPTPANPFADAALDLFDAIEAAAEQSAPPAGRRARNANRREPEPALLASPPLPAALPAMPVEPARAVEPQPSVASQPRLERAPPVDDRPPVPAVQPIVLGADAAAQKEKKRGWWRR